MGITKKEFGKIGDKEVFLFELTNDNKMSVGITTYGGTIVSISTEDKNGSFGDVVLGYPDLKGYMNGTSHQGALIGRFGNRIADGRFTLDGVEYKLDKNDNGVNHLHGGKTGYDTRVWDVLYTAEGKEPALSLTLVDEDGTEGYPGRVKVNVIYTLTADNAIQIEYFATTDKNTILNLTNHTYFNLEGYASGDVLDHEVQINADYFTPANANLIPTGEIRAVKGTVFDFTTSKTIGKDLVKEKEDEQLKLGGGYDHNFITGEDKVMKHIATVKAPVSGRIMDVYSDQPAVQLYIGNFLNGEIGKNGSRLNKRNGFCLETQHSPNTPNMPDFPTCKLCPGELYSYKTIYKFSKD